MIIIDTDVVSELARRRPGPAVVAIRHFQELGIDLIDPFELDAAPLP